MNPLISLVIPVYNVEKYLDKCMESVLAQTYDNFEVILVDDGSTDNSGKMCDEYAKRDSRVIVYHQQNSGVSVARNVGIENAKGEFISFIDSDDWIDKNYLQKLVSAQIKYNADLTICEYTNIYDDGKLRDRRRSFGSNVYYNDKSIIVREVIPKVFSFQSMDNPICRLYSKSIIRKYNLVFLPQVCIHEDCFFNFEYLNHIDSLTYINDSLYDRIIRNDSATRIYRENIYDESEVIFNCYDALLAKYGQGSNEEKQFVTRLYFEILRKYVCNPGTKCYHRKKWAQFYEFFSKEPMNKLWKYSLKASYWRFKDLLRIWLLKLKATYLLELIYEVTKE